MKILAVAFFLVCLSCGTPLNLDPIEQVMMSGHPAIMQVSHDPSYYEVQIIYTEIEKDSFGNSVFKDHTFRVDADTYFYPASTVKLPAAVLALEMADTRRTFNSNTNYTTKRDSLKHTIKDDVRQIFAVSDNEAYNRLYELLGRDTINNELMQKGISPVRISHRLSTSNANDSIRHSINFLVTEGDTLRQSVIWDTGIKKLSLKKQLKGKGFLRNDSLVKQPMDFSEKNYFPLQAQHELMKRIFYPESFTNKERFRLSEEHMNFLKEQMYKLPRNNGYSEKEYYDSYGKFFIYGDSKERIPASIKIYNKVGYAYGTLTDTAFIVDEDENIQFFLSATILVNKNGIFNDNVYEYDDIGIPFLAQLGRELYLYEHSKK